MQEILGSSFTPSDPPQEATTTGRTPRGKSLASVQVFEKANGGDPVEPGGARFFSETWGFSLVCFMVFMGFLGFFLWF